MVVNNVVKLFYHQDHLGTTDYLTNNADGKVISYVTYDDWGSLTAKAVLYMGVRELDLVQDYTGHPYDMVLGLYYAKARMYDADDRRFMAVDPVKGEIGNPQTLAQYTYCLDNPIKLIDYNGMLPESISYAEYTFSSQYFKAVEGRLFVSLRDYMNVFGSSKIVDCKNPNKNNLDILMRGKEREKQRIVRFENYTRVGSDKPVKAKIVSLGMSLFEKEQVKNAERLTYITVPAVSPDSGRKILVDFDYFNEIVCFSVETGFEPIVVIVRFIWPLDNPPSVTGASGFGKYGERDHAHRGVDFTPLVVGTPVKAVADGTILTSGYTNSRGFYLYINHYDGSQSVYEHLESSYVTQGSVVKQGDIIATSGNSGRYKNENGEWVNYGAHLHFELLLDVDEKTQKRFGLEPPFTWTSGTGFHVNPVQHLGK